MDFKSFSPYVGLRPFVSADRSLFYGRERELSRLVSLIIVNRAVVLHSASGAGKTSLVMAGLIPMLEAREFEILHPGRVSGMIPANVPYETINNIYIFNLLSGWSCGDIPEGAFFDTTLAEFLQARPPLLDADGDRILRLIVLDQFEEFFMTYADRWPDRRPFFQQVGQAMREDPCLRLLVVLRNEYVAELDSYQGLVPGRLRARLGLERLAREAAKRVVTAPLLRTNRRFSDTGISALLDNLFVQQIPTPGGAKVASVEFIEPVILQVVCRDLWETLPPDVTVIGHDEVKRFVTVDNSLLQFFEESIAASAMRTDVNEADIRNWFEHELITPDRTRSQVLRGSKMTGSLPNQVVDQLVNQHLIRGEKRDGSLWYELAHDRLIEPIRQSNSNWRLRREPDATGPQHSVESKRHQFSVRLMVGISISFITGVIIGFLLSQLLFFRPGFLGS